jgi:hypothetical protein
VKLAARHQDAVDFAHRCGRVAHATEHPDGDGCIEGLILCRQLLGGTADDVDRDRGVGGPLLGNRPRRGVGLNREHRVDLGRIELEGSPVAAADLDHVSAQPAQQPPPELTGHRIGPAQLSPLEQARES